MVSQEETIRMVFHDHAVAENNNQRSTNNYRTILGRNIRALRAEYGISRTALAKLIRVPVSRLRRVEQGDPAARLYDFHLKRIARVFDIAIDRLFDDVPVDE